ncbi:hypothetical protein BP6252_03173 [Coleophoma cylindrospora]|uniref:Uncharacterized protein n=1 Tax=Coleophoma cylindrospora TaxID=1849047 RepID=A0A3D8S7J5_9HELO|nr:hypothetical protein BP6252_03173 [Coleophoma cylindrospora]
MVILGGLEVLAAGYLLHKHNKNKKERARLEEEAAALEEQQYQILPPERHGRRHNSHDRKHSYERRHSHSRDRKHSRHRQDHHAGPSQSVPPPQYVAAVPPQYPVQQHPNNSQFFPPPPPNPPVPQQQQGGYYPPTGIPAHWEQKAQSTGGSQTHQMKYGFYEGQEHAPRGRSDHRDVLAMRGGDGSARGSTDSERQRVRFADERDSMRSPPPRYSDAI